VRAVPDRPGGERDFLGPRVGAHLQGPRVQADQRHAVGEDVVHLPGDPGAFGQPRLVDAQVLLGLQPGGALAQRAGQPPVRLHEQAPADGGDGELARTTTSTQSGNDGWSCSSEYTAPSGRARRRAAARPAPGGGSRR
jgi:hypothetical protein